MLWLSLAIGLMLALISYTPNDPSWSHITTSGSMSATTVGSDAGMDAVSNLGGHMGAWVADVLYTLLGTASWLLMVIACYEAWLPWRKRAEPTGVLRTIGYFFLLLSVAGLLELALPIAWLHQGFLGHLIATGLSGTMSTWGARLFLLVFVLITSAFCFDIGGWMGAKRRETGADKLKNSITATDPAHLTLPLDNDLSTLENADTSAKKEVKSDITHVTTSVTTSVTTPATPPVIKAAPISKRQRLSKFLAEIGLLSIAQPVVDPVVTPTPVPSPSSSQSSSSSSPASFTLSPTVARPVAGESEVLPIAQDSVTQKLDSQLMKEIMAHEANANQAKTKTPPSQALPVAPSLTRSANNLVEPSSLLAAVNNQAILQADPPVEMPTEPTAQLPVEPVSDVTTAPQNLNLATSRTLYNPLTPQFQPAIADKLIILPPDSLSSAPVMDNALSSSDLVSEDSWSDETLSKPGLFNAASFTESSSHLSAENTLTDNSALEREPLVVTDVFAELEQAVPVLSASSDTDISAPTQISLPQEPFVSQVVHQENVPQPTVISPSTAIDPVVAKNAETNLSDLHNDILFQSKSRAMQTAAFRASLSPLPELSILDLPELDRKPSYSVEQLQQMAELLEIKLQEFNVKSTVVNAEPGPVVTRFEVDLAAGIKASKVTGISRDLARSLSMASVRVVEVIPGKPYIGIEVPNPTREMVRLIELLETQDYRNPNSHISMAMGKDIAGRPVITDLARAPHMLVAGTTGSGKSVLVNSMLLSILLKYTPDQLRMILIDPKQLELANYNDIPHLLTPVVTDMNEAASALSWCVAEMERRYQLMSLFKVRKLDEFNKKVLAADAQGHPLLDPLWRPNDSVSVDKAPKLKTMPLIVIVADEFADMIMQVGKQAEELITRLAQKSRAAGIHLILATQRPSVDVITGLIKANIPVRAALRVNSKVDSRTILDAGGAEDMLGNGDMLFLGPGQIEPTRVHGAYVSDGEVNRVCDAWRERGAPDYIDNMLENFDLTAPSGGGDSGGGNLGDNDPLYDDAVAFVIETRKVSASSIQRKFSIGYNRAARLVDAMEEAGLVSGMGKSGKRELLM